MKSERFTFILVPDNDGANKKFSISRLNLFRLLSFFIIMIIVIFGFLIVTIPSYFDYSNMKNNYDNAMSERAKVIELYRDLERMKQIEVVVQKALGSNLVEDASLNERLGEFQNDEEIRSGYLNNIPSLLPISGMVTQEMIINNEEDVNNHFGIDIAVPKGEPIFASASGNVVFADWTPKYGNLIIIHHGNNYFTYYGHNELILVDQYKSVDIGDVIATSGNSGLSSGPHLHFEIWKDGVAIDPLLYFPSLNKSNISVKN